MVAIEATRAIAPDRLELRGARVELRGADDPATGLRLEGYAALFDVPSQPLQSPLGRTASGTLTLREDETGLYFSCLLPDTSLGRDVVELVRCGDVNQASFAFRAVADRWSGSGATGYVRELLDCDLFDVSAVTYPAYQQTSVAVRSVRVPTILTNPRSTSLTRARARVRVVSL